MRDPATNRAAIEAMVTAAATCIDGLTLVGLDVKPYRDTGIVRALATFAGPSDTLHLITISEEIEDRMATDFGATWKPADRIEVDAAKGGFRMTIDFDTTAAEAMAA